MRPAPPKKQGAGEQNTKNFLKSNKLMLHPLDGHKFKEKTALHILFHRLNTYEAQIILEQIKRTNILNMLKLFLKRDTGLKENGLSSFYY